MEYSAQLASNPFYLLTDVVDDVACLQTVRQNVPRVGLDLKLARQRIRLVEPQRVFNSESSCSKGAEVIEKHGDVDVGSPFSCFGTGSPRRKRILEIQESRELSVLFLVGLGKVDCLRIALQNIHALLRHFGHIDRRRFL